MSTTSLSILGHVLRSARGLLGRSPEQVASVTGLSGKTLRRLEAGHVRRPRLLTLHSLAGYYALDPAVLRALVDWADLDGDAVRARLADLEGQATPSDEAAESVAMRLARRGGGRLAAQRQAPRGNEIEAMIDDFLSLDRRRRTLVRMLVADLRLAQVRETSGS